MRRRDFVTLLCGTAAAAWPVAGSAQQAVKRVIGFLSLSSPGPHAPFVAAFNQGLREVGFIEGQNLAIEYRWAEGQFDRLPALAADLARGKVDVIAAVSGEVSIRAAVSANSAIPVVFIAGSDPVESGLVTSLARPGGNITGFSMISFELMSKRLELLSELVPQIRVVALLVNPNYHSANGGMIPLVQRAASAKGMQLHIVKASKEDDFEPAFASLVQQKVNALVVGTDPFLPAGANRSWHWRRVTPSRRSMSGKNLSRRAALSVTGRALPLFIVRLASTSGRSSRALSRRICRSNNRPTLSWSSISRPPRLSASPCR